MILPSFKMQSWLSRIAKHTTGKTNICNNNVCIAIHYDVYIANHFSILSLTLVRRVTDTVLLLTPIR